MEANLISYESMLAARESARWAYWSMIGTWLAGIATFAAVVTSLYIAKMRPKPRIKCDITLSAMRTSGWKKGIGIHIANIGIMPINISSIVWHFDGDTTFMHDFEPEGSNLPKKLEHGESALFFIQNDEKINWGKDVKKFILENNGKIDRIRISVNLGTTDNFFIKPHKSIIQMIKDS
ncbi:hypothetical protein [Serratia sp. 1D1416]|uniref:hypothetical protein n=1 Tax=Serratia sp. 1D1416 TaxID=2447890 RepID=UPI001013CBEF|nr:hypothetical protein [Serratia sp. 1D1416]